MDLEWRMLRRKLALLERGGLGGDIGRFGVLGDGAEDRVAGDLGQLQFIFVQQLLDGLPRRDVRIFSLTAGNGMRA